MATSERGRRYPIGAEVRGDGTHFRVWAPRCSRVDVVFENAALAVAPLDAERDGYFAAFVNGAKAGMRYRFRLDGGACFSDPASHYQPEGPHGPSEIVDANAYAWGDRTWKGCGPSGQIVYEMHIGTFTPEGTWAAAARELAELAALGITCIEMMPIAQFPGRFGWGYDGVNMFAPTCQYGSPTDLRRFIDVAHGLGLGVILDVVYNHFGPDGNYLGQFSADYVTGEHTTDWGDAINFHRQNGAAVREFFTTNAAYWVREFHFDGVRLDATQNIYDTWPEHILVDIGAAVRQAAAGRATFIVNENEPQHARLVRPVERGGAGLDALWNDDFHHAAVVAATGHNEAYYTDYKGTPQELISALKWGYLYQGQRYKWQKKRRGTAALDLPATAYVNFLENHDQVANSGDGARLHARTSPGRYRSLSALLLLAPATPMIFQGQEFASSAPFLFFADHDATLGALVHQGRREFLAQFPSLAGEAAQALIHDPADESTFAACKLDLRERESHAHTYALYRDLIALRRADAVFSSQRADRMHGAVLDAEALCLRFLGEHGDDRLLIVNLGRDVTLDPAPEPLLAPPDGARWRVLWSSEDPRYGGLGTPPIDREESWHLVGHAAIVLAPEPESEHVP